MTDTYSVLGIDLGTRKCGVCWISGTEIVCLKTFRTNELTKQLSRIAEQQHAFPLDCVVVDAPMDAASGSGFRLIDRVFMRGMFNNNHVGLQPNNPDLLNMLSEIESLREWCKSIEITYSNDFSTVHRKVLRETMPNPALGILSPPRVLLEFKRMLRFRYGRGSNIAPIIVAFESLQDKSNIELFQCISGAPTKWKLLEAFAAETRTEQADDLVAALVCATLAWWHSNSSDVSYVHEPRGHYLLPPKTMIAPEWREELCRILDDSDFVNVKSNLCSDTET